MFRGLLSRLTGGAPPQRAQACAAPTAAASADTLTGAAAGGAPGAGPVFSSRAVRDATLVTGTIDLLKRFADGQAGADEVGLKLNALSPDLFNFLQVSADPALIARAAARAHEARGPKALELQRMLDDLGDVGAAVPRHPAPTPRVASAGPAPAVAAGPVRPMPPPVSDLPDVPAPPPAAKPAELPPAIPRMAKADADQRRARLLESLTDHLSSTEAAR